MRSQRPRQYYCRCGTRLAKDNPGRQCARCEHIVRDKLIAPPEVSAEFWQTEHADAARQLETSLVLHKTSYPRSRAITQMIYATNYARQGQLEPACQLGIAAIPAVGRLRSQRTREYLRDLRDHLAPYRHEPQVREFSEQAREVLATRCI